MDPAAPRAARRRYQPAHPLARLAQATVEAYLTRGELPYPDPLPPELQGQAAAFVSLHLDDGSLRGCIGTFQPAQENIAQEVVANAISAATRDPRFWPVQPDELSRLRYSVDILSPPEPVSDPAHLDPKVYGLIVENGYRRGLLLPDIPGVATVEAQLAICRQKAGIGLDEPATLYRFTVRRYE